MKNLILLFAIFLTSFTNAQVDRAIGGPGSGRAPQKKDQKPPDFVQQSTDNLTKQLTLDAFQSAVIKGILEDYKKAIEAIQTAQIPDEAKPEKYQNEKDKMEAKIMAQLNKDQAAKFAAFKDKKSGKKGKKDKDYLEDNKTKKDSL